MRLLIIDDDKVFADRLGIAMEKRGFKVCTAYSADEGIEKAHDFNPEYALIDLKIGEDSGLNVVEELNICFHECRIIIMTSFGNIATAVAAVKAGAIDYLSKPVDAEMAEKALLNSDDKHLPPPPEYPMTVDRVKWEHIQRIYEQCDGNISLTARKLKMHRRTLQRILSKHAPLESEKLESPNETN